MFLNTFPQQYHIPGGAPVPPDGPGARGPGTGARSLTTAPGPRPRIRARGPGPAVVVVKARGPILGTPLAEDEARWDEQACVLELRTEVNLSPQIAHVLDFLR